MLKSYIFLIGLALIFVCSQGKVGAAQGSPNPSAVDQERLEALQPTLKQILDVDPNKVPWGVNLELVLERGTEARNKSLDKYDFSSRITLYQKHKSKAKTLSEQYAVLGERIDQINGNAEKKLKSLDSVNILKRLSMKKKIEQDRDGALQSLQEQMAKLKNDLQTNTMHMKNLIVTIAKKTGLTQDQIAKLPDFDSWKKMQKPTPQEAPQRPQQPAPQPQAQKPQSRPLPPLPSRPPSRLPPPIPSQSAG